MGEANAASFVGSLTSNPSLPPPLEARTEEKSRHRQASCHQRRSCPLQSPSEAAITCLAIAIDFAGIRCVERKAMGQARDRRGRESCYCVCCRLSIIAIMEPRGGRHRCELAEGERGYKNVQFPSFFQEWTQQVQDMLNTKKFGDIAFGDKDFKNAIEYYSKVRRYTFSLNSGAVEELELDSFGLSIMPSSLVSTYSLLVEDVLEVVSDAVVVRKATASRIQRLSKVPSFQ
ncbi:putative serine/threonine-protein kinase [Arachis hypogaea]|nr:putative serine/threonine-protein kinase [Arachis hypogaea]